MPPSEIILPSCSQHLPIESLGKEGDELSGVGNSWKEFTFGEVVDGRFQHRFMRLWVLFVCGVKAITTSALVEPRSEPVSSDL